MLPFNITTKDQQSLYAWLVIPIRVYSKHEAEIVKDPSGIALDVRKRLGFNLLANDPESRLVIYCKSVRRDI